MGDARWGLGVRETASGPRFELIHRATRRHLQGFDWGSGNVQALVVDGKPTRLLPPSADPAPLSSPPSQPDDCGPYPWIDYLKTSRINGGWKDGAFAVLVVTQAPGDFESTAFERRGLSQHQPSGFDIADMQAFWKAWGATGACSLDGGFSTQACFDTPEGPRMLDCSTDGPVPVTRDLRTTCIPVLLYPYIVERWAQVPAPGVRMKLPSGLARPIVIRQESP